MAWNVPAAFAAGSTLTAAALNAIRDSLNAIGDPWQAYTPTWLAATTNPTLGDGTLTGAHLRAGKLIHFRLQLAIGGTTTLGSGVWTFTLPVPPAASSGRLLFLGDARSESAPLGDHPVFGINTGGVGMTMKALPATAGNALINLSATSPFGWAAGDSLTITGTYEAS